MTTTRTEYAQNLRRLADLLDQRTYLPLPVDIRPSGLVYYAQGTVEAVLAITDLMTEITLERDPSADFPLTIIGTLGRFPTVIRVAARVALAGQVSTPELNPQLAALANVRAQAS